MKRTGMDTVAGSLYLREIAKPDKGQFPPRLGLIPFPNPTPPPKRGVVIFI
jgi:hypothetical protein